MRGLLMSQDSRELIIVPIRRARSRQSILYYACPCDNETDAAGRRRGVRPRPAIKFTPSGMMHKRSEIGMGQRGNQGFIFSINNVLEQYLNLTLVQILFGRIAVFPRRNKIPT